jgi:hypothetical protein
MSFYQVLLSEGSKGKMRKVSKRLEREFTHCINFHGIKVRNAADLLYCFLFSVKSIDMNFSCRSQEGTKVALLFGSLVLTVTLLDGVFNQTKGNAVDLSSLLTPRFDVTRVVDDGDRFDAADKSESEDL